MKRFCKRCGEIFPADGKFARICPNCRKKAVHTVQGFKTCPEWLKKKYRIGVKFICMECGKNEEEVGKLEPHRIVRGNKGGKYTLIPLNEKGSNVKVVCNKCHKMYHVGEFK